MRAYLIPELSVFFPAYNEEKNIKKTVLEAIKILKEITPRWEVIVIDDGSKDKTGEVVERIIKKYPGTVKLITHTSNLGYGVALRDGFYNARYNWITFTDSDGQFEFRDIYRLIAKQKETNADLVIGYYLGRKVAFHRILGSWAWQWAVFFLFGMKVKDTDCAFKLIRKKVIDTIPKLESQRGPFISSELLIKSRRAGFKIVEEGVTHRARTAGIEGGASLKVILSGMRDLIVFWFKINLSK